MQGEEYYVLDKKTMIQVRSIMHKARHCIKESFFPLVRIMSHNINVITGHNRADK